MMLTKEQKAFVLKKLESQFGVVNLNCDGFDIKLNVEQNKMRLVIGIYINGWVKGTWCFDEGHPESKYLPIKSKAYYTPKRKAEIIKAFGKRKAKEMFPKLDDAYEYRNASFPSAKAALAHLIKVSENIELITEMPHAEI